MKRITRLLPTVALLALCAAAAVAQISWLALAALMAAVALANAHEALERAPGSVVLGSAYFDLPAATFLLKEMYDGQTVEAEDYRDNPLFTMMEKDTEFYGKSKPIPLIYGAGQGRSSTFANAQSNQSATQGAEFQLTRRHDYQIFTLDNETKLSMQSSKGAFANWIEAVVEPERRNLINSAASALYRAGTGSIGQISAAGVSTGVITLLNLADVVQFEINMTLQANATDGGASPRAGIGYVIAVDRFLGKITVASTGIGGAAATPSGWAASDFLLVQGDLNSKMIGLSGWILNAAPATTDNFFGVNRSADRFRLAGGYYDASGQPIEEGVSDALQLLGREGAGNAVCMTNFGTYGALQKALGAKVVYEKLSSGEISFDTIVVNGPKGKVNVIPDRNCQPLTGWLLKLSTWKLNSLGMLPQLLTYEDNNQALRVSNADAMEGRFGYYGNPSCNAPGSNCQILFGA